jgi:hypothetical protein
MGRYGALAVSVPGSPTDLDLDTLELFARFFTLEELIADFHLLDLSVRELTVLKIAFLHEIARQLAEQPTLRDSVRTRIGEVMDALRPPTST